MINILNYYEDEKKKQLQNKIVMLKKLCLRILFINEYQIYNIKKLQENINNMNNAINSINLISYKKGDFDHIIINLNVSKEKNYSLISRINLLNYETNVLKQLIKKMKEKFKHLNLQNDEIINLKYDISNNMNEKMKHIKTSLLTNQETCNLKKKCFDDCLLYLKQLYTFIKNYENNNDKLNIKSQIINKDKNLHFNYIHKYNEDILVDENYINDFLIYIEKYIYSLNFYLPTQNFNYKKYLLHNGSIHNITLDTHASSKEYLQKEDSSEFNQHGHNLLRDSLNLNEQQENKDHLQHEEHTHEEEPKDANGDMVNIEDANGDMVNIEDANGDM
ncbi:hypothetical protein PFNF54_01645, partial [Plasmodium falciparum NF54]